MQQEPFARAKSAWDFTALPLEGFASSFIFTIAGMPISLRSLSSRA
ncbi:MAG: hypothetical protein K9G11_03390 [Rickettsiaceae bacterium]|nr:hypothetical protein [Rickettsiaceae bacterium]